MGACLGKHHKENHQKIAKNAGENLQNEDEISQFNSSVSSEPPRSPILVPGSEAQVPGSGNGQTGNTSIDIYEPETSISSNGSGIVKREFITRKNIDDLVLKTLGVIRLLVDNDQEPPPSMMKLHKIADQEIGWLHVVQSMIEVIPMEDPLGPATITLLLDDCPLPTKETVIKLTNLFDLRSLEPKESLVNAKIHRNIAIVLGCIAEKLAGPRSVALFTQGTLEYLISNLDPQVHTAVIMFSIIALEKFAQTSENKITILKQLNALKSNPLLTLESWAQDCQNFMKRQVGFCAQWCLDNLFIIPERVLSYTSVDLTNVNVLLNSNDVSEYLKISPSGLEARSDAASFESVRCTFQVDSGSWFYEVLIITSGVMQIGWATKNSKFLNHEGYGIGDDEYSLAIDGCRQLMWHNALSEIQSEFEHCWKPGDIIGSLLDIDRTEIIFYHNGKQLKSFNNVFSQVNSGFFAAASFMSFQQCQFNFGAIPFKFPPKKRHFQAFNDHGTLPPEDKVILPRHMMLELLKKHTVNEDACTLCFDARACIEVLPCAHTGFCFKCSAQLESCPMCRGPIFN